LTLVSRCSIPCSSHTRSKMETSIYRVEVGWLPRFWT
jgi:hypothetical protein